MAQRGQRPGLPLEPLFQIGIVGDVRGQNLDRDGAIQSCVVRLADLSHSASAYGGKDLDGPSRVLESAPSIYMKLSPGSFQHSVLEEPGPLIRLVQGTNRVGLQDPHALER